MMSDPVQEVKRQTQRYWYIDGLTELGAGALILLLGLLYLLIALLGTSTCRRLVDGHRRAGHRCWWDI